VAVAGEVQTTGSRRMARGGLGKWFAEDWVDVKTGKPCGRSGDKDKRGYPACRPKKVVEKMTAAEKRSMSKKKTGPERKQWPVTASGKRRGR